MSDNSWVLRGIEPEARQKAEEEAARLGVSVADYLTELVVRRAVLDQLSATSEAEQTQSEPDEAAIFAPPPESPEGFAVRQRLKALERRLGTAVGSLDGAVHGLDTSLFDITARLGDAEALAGDTAHALGQTQQEVSNAVAGLQIHLAVVEDNFGSQAEAQEQRSAGLERRLEGVEYVARGAERSAAILADAHEALKHAVAEDFSAFTHDTADRLNASLADVRAAADLAAEQADAAVAHLITELRGVRAAIEDRLEESVEDTRNRMHAAFADAADRMATLAERVADNERFVSRTAEQLRVQLTDVEDGAQIALEETAHALREADALMAANLGRATQEHYAAVEAVRADLAAQIGAMREDQVTQLARLKLVDVALGNTLNGMADLAGSIEQRADAIESQLHVVQRQAGEDWEQRFDAVTARLSRGEHQAQGLQQKISADFDRIEASTFAALEKLRRDIGAGDAAMAQQVEATLEELRGELTEVRNRAINEVHLLREEHTGALARLTLLDTALTRMEGATITTNARLEEVETAPRGLDPDLERRIAQLEYAAANAETDQALSVVGRDVAALAQRINASDTTAADRLTALQQQLEAHEGQAGELNESLQGVARMLNRVAAQSVETSQRADERAHNVELALADLRLEVFANAENNNASAAVQTLNERMIAFELRQSSALDGLREDIARFVADNDRRLEGLETRTPEPASGDLATEFETLRTRIEERVLGVELRSVRTLEQVVDTVALLEQRLLGAGADEDEAAKSA